MKYLSSEVAFGKLKASTRRPIVRKELG